MSDPAVQPAPIDLRHLSIEQLQQLRFVLSVLSLHQLVHLAARLKQICLDPGLGRVTVTIEKGHPSKIEGQDSELFLPNLMPEKLDELMRSYSAE